MTKASEALTLLDLEESGRFALAGAAHVDLVPAANLPWRVVAECIEYDLAFVMLVAGGRSMPANQIPRLRRSWVAREGLVEGDDLQRLVWIVGTFWRPLEIDLRMLHGVRLGEQWRSRRWRELLNMIDYLPRAAWTQQAMLNNPEYADGVSKTLAKRKLEADPNEEPEGPPLVEYSPEVAALYHVVDAVNALRHLTAQAHGDGKRKPTPIPPMPRPRTLVDRMTAKQERALRWTKHDQLANRMLANRQKT